MRRPALPSLLALALLLATSPRPAQANPPRADGQPWVPRYQGPYAPQRFNPAQELWGLALIGTGAVIGGLGLYTLEGDGAPCAAGGCADAEPYDAPQLGAGLLIGGVFLAGVGLYLVFTTPAPPRIVGLPSPAWSVEAGVEAGLLRTRLRF